MNHDMGNMQNNGMKNGTGMMGSPGMMKNHTGGGMHMMMMMQMYFFASEKATILFKQWHTSSAAELFGSCLALFIIGVLYEGLKVWRQKLQRRPCTLQLHETVVGEGIHENNLINKKERRPRCVRSRLSKEHIIQTVLHILQVFVGYMLMLAVMTYNAWICIAIILGAGMGHFLFAVEPPIVDNAEHCN